MVKAVDKGEAPFQLMSILLNAIVRTRTSVFTLVREKGVLVSITGSHVRRIDYYHEVRRRHECHMAVRK